MNPREVLEVNLPLVEQVVGRVCRRARLYGADAEDFASHVFLELIDSDYAVLRKWQGGSLATYLAVVIQRMLIDLWRSRGRWTPSAEARRHGRAGVALETLLVRDRRTLPEAVAAVQAIDRSLTVAKLEQLARQLPPRLPPTQIVPLADDAADRYVASDSAEERVRAEEVRRTSDRTNRTIRAALNGMSLEDRMLMRLRFLSSMSIADIARMMNVPQRPLYRRIESLLAQLRRDLAAEGVDAVALAEVMRSSTEQIDFGWKTDDALPSPVLESGSFGEGDRR